MSLVEQVQRLARWNVWANGVVGGVLEAAGGEPVAALAAYQHIYETELTWLRRMDGRPSPNVPLWSPPDLAQAQAWRTEADRLMARIAATADEAFLASHFAYANSRGQHFNDEIDLPLIHTFMHSQQYRGEAAAFLNAAGRRVPDFDLIFWSRLGEPSTS
jgi:uncharacterized damage-inducible protein DinB